MNPVDWPLWLNITAGVALGALAVLLWWLKERDHYGLDWPLAGLAFVVIAGLAVAIPASIRAEDAYQAWCEAQGGLVMSRSDVSSVTTVDGKGNVGIGTSTSTTTFCLSADGRILDVG